jgi:hypothetical protein
MAARGSRGKRGLWRLWQVDLKAMITGMVQCDGVGWCSVGFVWEEEVLLNQRVQKPAKLRVLGCCRLGRNFT